MTRKLKVFQAQLGFYDTVVAAPSQASALRAWESHRNLFAEGVAKPATDEKAIEAALAKPEVPLRRAVGTNDPFSLKAGTPHLPDEPRPDKTPTPVKKVAPPDRSSLDAAEARLRSLDEDRKQDEEGLHGRDEQLAAEERSIQERRAEFDADKAKAAERHRKQLAEAHAALARERRAFKKAGGRD